MDGLCKEAQKERQMEEGAASVWFVLENGLKVGRMNRISFFQ